MFLYSGTILSRILHLLIVKVISRYRHETLIWDEIVSNVVDTADKDGAHVQLREETALFTDSLVIQVDFAE